MYHRIVQTGGALPMHRIASLALIAVAVSVTGCAASQAPKVAADPNAPLCAFGGLTPASPEWAKCLATMAVNPDRDLLAALIAARAETEASGVPDVRAVLAKRTVPIDAEYLRRMTVRRAQAASAGTADCGAWHWDAGMVACRP
jgi:hypothetical protein